MPWSFTPKKRLVYITNRGRGYSMFIAVALMTVHTGITETDIAAIRIHVFEEKHKLAAGFTYFFPSVEMALAWQRLEQGNFTELDVLLLRHELEELTIMKVKGV